MNNPTKPSPTRRRALQALAMSLLLPMPVKAQSTTQPFDQWVADFRARALARGVSDATYTRVMHGQPA
jgi:membrane-bound lytic murein transglycosylase B